MHARGGGEVAQWAGGASDGDEQKKLGVDHPDTLTSMNSQKIVQRFKCCSLYEVQNPTRGNIRVLCRTLGQKYENLRMQFSKPVEIFVYVYSFQTGRLLSSKLSKQGEIHDCYIF